MTTATATDRARTTRRYNAILALLAGATTEGERAAARAAQVRMLNAPRHHRTLCGDHPLAKIDGFSWEITEALRACWCDRTNSTKGDRAIGAVLLRGFDFKELRNALRSHRATMRAQWRGGHYIGTESLKRLSCQEYLLLTALRASCASEGMSKSEIATFEHTAR